MTLETFRYQMMVKGYMNKKELGEFLGCGYKTATKAYNAMTKDIEAEGMERLDGGFILTKRAIAYLGLTEKKITEAYDRQEETKKG